MEINTKTIKMLTSINSKLFCTTLSDLKKDEDFFKCGGKV